MFASLFLLAGLAVQTSPAPKYVEPKIVAVSMFKNGYAFLTREIAIENNEAAVVQIPRASLGTLWFWTDTGSIESVTSAAQPDGSGSQAPLPNLEAILNANVGRTLAVEYRDAANQLRTASGTLRSVSTVVVIERPTGKLVISRDSIVSVDSNDPKFVWKQEIPPRSPGMYYRVLTRGNPKKVTMLSLERGMAWAPAYAVDITDPKRLTLVARATLLNDLANLDNVRGRLITGFPNITFVNFMEPLTSGMPLDAWLANVSPSPGGFGGGGMAGAARGMLGQSAAAPMRDAANWDSVPEAGGRGEQLGELFFYNLPDLSLKAGSRSMQTLFRAGADYRHVYCWDVADAVMNNVEFRPVPPGPGETEIVWHALRFNNTAGQPLTTAPATVFKQGEMIGQAMMNYVPNGAEVELRINRSLDISAEQNEEEIARERGAVKRPDGFPILDLVTVRGTLEVKNRKAEGVELSIRKSFTGEFVSADQNPKVTRTLKGLRDANGGGTIAWSVKVAPGKTLTLGYQYKVFVRSQQ